MNIKIYLPAIGISCLTYKIANVILESKFDQLWLIVALAALMLIIMIPEMSNPNNRLRLVYGIIVGVLCVKLPCSLMFVVVVLSNIVSHYDPFEGKQV